MDSIRQNKISKVLLKEIGPLLQKSFTHLYSGSLATVTVVRISPDLSIAKVYVSVFGGSAPEKVIDNLKDEQKEIRLRLGRIIKNQIRKIPELHFYLDDSAEKASRIEELLKK